MEPLAFQINRSACRLCRTSRLRPLVSQWPRRCPSTPTSQPATKPVKRWVSNGKAHAYASGGSKQSPHMSRAPRPRLHPGQDAQAIQELSNKVLKHASIPSEEQALNALRAIERVAQKITGSSTEQQLQEKVDGDPASALLSLDARPAQAQSEASIETINTLSALAYKLVKHPTVFITPDILSTYVTIQSVLERPSSFPEIFNLYTSKPTPVIEKGKDRVTYSPQDSRAIATAIPAKLADTALNTAIAQRDLQLALEIIDSTFRTTSYKRSKLFRKALPPAVAAALAPLAAYSLASNLATMQLGLPPEDFTMFAFAGILTYGAAVGTIGYVALTTTNDQMERVTWAIGMPLWERWVREEERAACDRVAKAWGFRERRKWGEEVGAEWDELREWLGYKGMILDKVGLMEGME